MENKLKLAREKINKIDSEMTKLFVERMQASEMVAEYKQEHGLEILDPIREAEVIRQNSEAVENDIYREYYVNFQKSLMSISRAYQSQLIEDTRDISSGASCSTASAGNRNVTLNMNLGENSYPITIGHGLLERANEYFNLDRKVFIITDEGVPDKYAEAVKCLCKDATVYTVPQGEDSKSFATLEAVLTQMTKAELGRGDCIVAVGGGVVGDLSGFAASVYMRGIDFYNIPTTLLSQVDSSIGGKAAINLDGIKNIVGSFKQPKAVLIDTDVLSTLPKRQLRNGLCETIKMAATSDADLFERLEGLSEDDIYNNIEEIIIKALKIKKSVVEEDEREGGIRKILNFGHTLGHGIEANEELSSLYHGECVAIGMIPTATKEAKERLISLLNKVSLPTEYRGDIHSALDFVTHDKKCSSGVISVILCDKIGTCKIEEMSVEEFKKMVLNHFN